MAWILSFLAMISVAVLFTSLLMLVAAHSRKSTALFIEAAKELKVCRVCTTLALARQDRCSDCRSVTWGYVPQSLVRDVDIDALKNGPEPAKLAGYRSADWPPRDPIARSEEMQSIPDNDPDSAAMLASLASIVGIWGIGHIYAGKAMKGGLLMLAGASAWGLFFLFTILWHHWAVGYSFIALLLVAWAWQTRWAVDFAVERGRFRDRKWTSLRKSLGDKPGAGMF
ncbi:MAG: hypothetical protein IH955_02095 [Chloroflexi bacterium]|nr:hypothetical protein [Chloroflexota bacterium]